MWRDELTELTGYKLEEVVDCGEELWNFYEKMFPSHRVRQRGRGPKGGKAMCYSSLLPLFPVVFFACG